MYMTGDEIRALSRRIPEIVCATDEELSFWMDEAFDVLNNFCQQDFTYERQVTKRARHTTGTLVYLPKVLGGDITIVDGCGETIFASSTSAACSTRPVEVFPGSFVLGYYRFNQRYPVNANAHVLFVTGDWGYFNTPTDLVVNGANVLKRQYEAHRVDTVSHNQADTLNTITAPDATDNDSAAILINELKAVINSHFGDFVVHVEADTNTSNLPDAIDQTTTIQILQDLTQRFNAHLLNTGSHVEADTSNRFTDSVDVEGSVMPRVIRRVFLRLVQRLAIRDEAEDHRQINSPYTTETLGDGYSYDLSNGTLRNLIRPEEAHMLLPYVNRGRVVV